jgi:hypothetical protein
MTKPLISPDFTIDDIHRIREYNHEVTRDMTFEERRNYYREKASAFKEKLMKEKHSAK